MRPQPPDGRGRAAGLAAWLAQAPGAALRLLCHPEAELDLAGALARHAAHDDICLLVGPEGGWSDEELEQARAAGVQAVRFGPGCCAPKPRASP